MTISGIRVIYFGKVVIVEDCPAPLEPQDTLLSHRQDNLMTYPVAPRRTDLGMLEFSFAGDTNVAFAETSSLLKPLEIEVLEPYCLRSFILTLRCVEFATEACVVVRSQLSRCVHAVSLISDQYVAAPLLFLVKDRDQDDQHLPLVREISLTDLDKGKPDPVGVAHVFAVSVNLVADTSAVLKLVSDNIYSIYPIIKNSEYQLIKNLDIQSTSLIGERTQMTLDRCLSQTPAQFIQYLTQWSVKTYRETLAFHIAQHGNELPDHLDANDVSPFCYHGHDDSPLRPTQSSGCSNPYAESPSKSGEQEIVQNNENVVIASWPELRPIERSNVVDFLANLLTRWPEFGSEIWDNLGLLQSADDEILRNKVGFVRKRLAILTSRIMESDLGTQNLGM